MLGQVSNHGSEVDIIENQLSKALVSGVKRGKRKILEKAEPVK